MDRDTLRLPALLRRDLRELHALPSGSLPEGGVQWGPALGEQTAP